NQIAGPDSAPAIGRVLPVVHERSVGHHSAKFDSPENTGFGLPVDPSTQRYAARGLLADEMPCPLRSPIRNQDLGVCQQGLDLTTNLVVNSQQFTGMARSIAPQNSQG